MNEFILIAVIYINSSTGGFQMLPIGEYPDKKTCQEYSAQVIKDLAEPSRTIRATCLPKSAMEKGKALTKEKK